jgi:hypothetical protein
MKALTLWSGAGGSNRDIHFVDSRSSVRLPGLKKLSPVCLYYLYKFLLYHSLDKLIGNVRR